jgi:fatty acid desaturase
LWWLPFWAAFVPCVFLAHRVGILTHEYWHGAPFVQYRYNHAVVTLWDGVMMTFGLLEVTRGMHLIHHRWLNVPAPHSPPPPAGGEKFGQGGFGMAATVAALRHLFSGGDQPGHRKPYVKRNRMVMGFVLSLVTASIWVLTGNAGMLWRTFLVVGFTIVVPGSLRDTVEHNSEPGDTGFANDYRPIVPMFNVNRHIHHHEEPTVPWYLLEWRTSNPLPPAAYYTHWVRKYVKHELVRMQPMPKRVVHQRPKKDL